MNRKHPTPHAIHARWLLFPWPLPMNSISVLGAVVLIFVLCKFFVWFVFLREGLTVYLRLTLNSLCSLRRPQSFSLLCAGIRGMHHQLVFLNRIPYIKMTAGRDCSQISWKCEGPLSYICRILHVQLLVDSDP
jgi:hypothetical protein